MKNFIIRPLLLIFISYAIGIVIAKFFTLPFFLVSFFLMSSVFVFLIVKKQSKWRVVLLCMIFLFLGMLRLHIAETVSKNHIANKSRFYRNKVVEVQGIIVSDIEYRKAFKGDKTSFTLNLKKIKSPWGWKPVEGKVLVNIFRKQACFYGDIIKLEGKLHKPYALSGGVFSYREYLYNRGIRFIFSVKRKARVEILKHNQGNSLKILSLKIRRKCRSILSKYHTYCESGLLKAMLFGDRTEIPEHIKSLFINTGTIHIIAISGLHMGIISGLIFLLLKLLGLQGKWAGALSIAFLILYALLTGGRVSVIRSVIMLSFVFMGSVLERRVDAMSLISLAGFCLLILNPLNIFEIGSQLSFICVFVILVIYPKVSNLFIKLKAEDGIARISIWFLRSLGVSLSVWLGIAGLIVYYFHVITPIAIIANILIVPLLPLVLIAGILCIISGLFGWGIAGFFAMSNKLILNCLVSVLFLLNKVPGAQIALESVGLFWVIGYYFVLIGVVFVATRVLKKEPAHAI